MKKSKEEALQKIVELMRGNELYPRELKEAFCQQEQQELPQVTCEIEVLTSEGHGLGDILAEYLAANKYILDPKVVRMLNAEIDLDYLDWVLTGTPKRKS